MSTHNNFSKNKCWSCEFYDGNKEHKKSFLGGDYVSTDSSANCLKKKTRVFEDNYSCSHYIKWSVLQSVLIERAQREEKERQAKQREEERRKQFEQRSNTIPVHHYEVDREKLAIERAENEAKCVEEAKQQRIIQQKKYIVKIRKSPIKYTIVSTIISLVAFLFGWIPHWYYLSRLHMLEYLLDSWLELGHNKTDGTGKELVIDISNYTSKANMAIIVPFILLIVGIVITIVIFVLTKRSVPSRIAIAKKNLEKLEN